VKYGVEEESDISAMSPLCGKNLKINPYILLYAMGILPAMAITS